MSAITSDVWYLDLDYQGAPRLIATGVLETDEGLLLVDPGPTVALDTLKRKLRDEDVSLGDVHALLLTHIHLDHAGAAGSLVREQPDVQVYVHERGARHVVNPERLLRSARRIYGDRMNQLWGDVLAIPEANVHPLSGDETIAPGGRSLEVAYTPGHAVHHVSYLDVSTNTAFVGDVAGMRVRGADYVLPVAPPPDVELDAWHASIDTVRAWQPDRLFLTHFGAFDDVDRHLDAMSTRLDIFADAVRATLNNDADDREQAERFQDQQVVAMRKQVPEPLWAPYEQFGQPRESWHGLARYWRKRS